MMTLQQPSGKHKTKTQLEHSQNQIQIQIQIQNKIRRDVTTRALPASKCSGSRCVGRSVARRPTGSPGRGATACRTRHGCLGRWRTRWTNSTCPEDVLRLGEWVGEWEWDWEWVSESECIMSRSMHSCEVIMASPGSIGTQYCQFSK